MIIFSRLSKQLLFNILLLLLLVYFVYHTVYGERGLISYFKLNQQLTKAYLTLDNLTAERVDLEHHAKLLKSGDKDFLDEQARHLLGVASKKEQLFSTNKKDSIVNDKN